MNAMYTTALHADLPAPGYIIGGDRGALLKQLIELDVMRGRVDKTGRPLTDDQRVAALVAEEQSRLLAGKSPKDAATLRRAWAALALSEQSLNPPPTPAEVDAIRRRAAAALALGKPTAAQAARAHRRAAAAIARADGYLKHSEAERAEREGKDVIDRSIRKREEWCERVVLALLPRLLKLGIRQIGTGPQRKIRCAILPMQDKRYGECWSSLRSPDGKTNLISLSIDHDAPLEAVHTLCHEVLHALVDNENSGDHGHGGQWKGYADILGIEARGHDRPHRTDQMLREVLAAVGPMPA